MSLDYQSKPTNELRKSKKTTQLDKENVESSLGQLSLEKRNVSQATHISKSKLKPSRAAVISKIQDTPDGEDYSDEAFDDQPV